MKEALEKAVNAWYIEWLQSHSRFEDDFDTELERLLPDHQFTYDPHSFGWIYLGEI